MVECAVASRAMRVRLPPPAPMSRPFIILDDRKWHVTEFSCPEKNELTVCAYGIDERTINLSEVTLVNSLMVIFLRDRGYNLDGLRSQFYFYVFHGVDDLEGQIQKIIGSKYEFVPLNCEWDGHIRKL